MYHLPSQVHREFVWNLLCNSHFDYRWTAHEFIPSGGAVRIQAGIKVTANAENWRSMCFYDGRICKNKMMIVTIFQHKSVPRLQEYTLFFSFEDFLVQKYPFFHYHGHLLIVIWHLKKKKTTFFCKIGNDHAAPLYYQWWIRVPGYFKNEKATISASGV